MLPGAFTTEGVIWMVLYFNLLLEASYISILSFSGVFLNVLGAGKMTQWVKPRKCENLSLDPRHPYQARPCSMGLSVGRWEADTEELVEVRRLQTR